jgi:nicotinamidase-related amidase
MNARNAVFPANRHALYERHGYSAAIASGGTSLEAHEVAVQRMIAGGINIMTWLALASEWQRDWARTETATALIDALRNHLGGSANAYLWEQQLLNTPVPGVAAGSERGWQAIRPESSV